METFSISFNSLQEEIVHFKGKVSEGGADVESEMVAMMREKVGLMSQLQEQTSPMCHFAHSVLSCPVGFEERRGPYLPCKG